MSKIQIKIRIFLWVALGLVVVWILYQGIVPFGKKSYSCDFSKPCYNIKKIQPADRVKILADNVDIIGNPVYFTLATPRSFNQAVISLKYKNKDDLPVIETGVLKDELLWRYDLKPIRNKTIDQLALAWRTVSGKGEAILFQRDSVGVESEIKYYQSIDEFLKELPPFEKIAVYNYDLNYNYKIVDYNSGQEKKELPSALRGAYQFYTYIKDEPLDFSFNFFDLNKNKDADGVDIFVYHYGQTIENMHLDGTSIATGAAGDIGNIEFNIANLPEGVYKIEVKASDDIITKKIFTRQTKIAFINKLWLTDSGSEKIKLYTDSQTINGQTINPASLQTIKIGDSALDIKETYKLYTADDFRDINELAIEKDDIIISGNGLFSFTASQLFNPIIKNVTNIDLNYEGINYVLANYASPRQIDDWQVAHATLDLSEAYREDGKYGFIISIPGLRADDNIEDKLELGEISIELTGKTLRQKISDIFSKL